MGRPIRVDAHTAKGSNINESKILVIMEANGEFPTEVPIYMQGESGNETEGQIKIIYLKPSLVYTQCKGFRHAEVACRYSKEIPTGLSKSGGRKELMTEDEMIVGDEPQPDNWMTVGEDDPTRSLDAPKNGKEDS